MTFCTSKRQYIKADSLTIGLVIRVNVGYKSIVQNLLSLQKNSQEVAVD